MVFPDIHGKAQRPLKVGDNKCNVLIFITTDCPIANQYSPQIREMCNQMSDQPVQFFLVHVDPDVTDAAAKKHAEDYGHVCPVIRDPKHLLVKHTGIDKTPEAVVVDRKGELVYRGRINNWYGDLGRKRVEPSKHELRDAIQAVLAGREVKVKRTEAVGCFVPPVN